MISRTLRRNGFTEESITGRLRSQALIPAGSSLRLGIGDDCAIYSPRGSKEDLLFTCDLYIEDVHFRRATHTAKDLAYNALTRSFSDIAAMGGSPRFALVALCVPAWADDKWVRRFFDVLLAAASDAGAALAGGDLSHARTLACDVTVCGAVPRGKALRRDGAKPGDGVYVSGRLGGSALGLATGKGAAWKRHIQPQARLALGEYLRTLRATSAIDISDGLSLDLRRICLASAVAAEIEEPPIFPGATLDHALHGGEEYELLFTARRATVVPPAFKGIPLTRIGTICKGQPGQVQLNGTTLASRGYDHFTSR